MRRATSARGKNTRSTKLRRNFFRNGCLKKTDEPSSIKKKKKPETRDGFVIFTTTLVITVATPKMLFAPTAASDNRKTRTTPKRTRFNNAAVFCGVSDDDENYHGVFDAS